MNFDLWKSQSGSQNSYHLSLVNENLSSPVTWLVYIQFKASDIKMNSSNSGKKDKSSSPSSWWKIATRIRSSSNSSKRKSGKCATLRGLCVSNDLRKCFYLNFNGKIGYFCVSANNAELKVPFHLVPFSLPCLFVFFQSFCCAIKTDCLIIVIVDKGKFVICV